MRWPEVRTRCGAIVIDLVVTWRHHHHHHFSGIGGATIPSSSPLTWGRSGGGDVALLSSLI